MELLHLRLISLFWLLSLFEDKISITGKVIRTNDGDFFDDKDIILQLSRREKRSSKPDGNLTCIGSDMKHYENYDELTRLLKCYSKKYPSITKLASAGKSVQGQELWYMQISDKPNVVEDGEPMFKYVGNMHGNEVISRQILIYLIEYLCDNYLTDKRVKELVDSTNIFILPSMNPDGFQMATEGECGYMYTNRKNKLTGRNNANDKDLNRNFPDQFKNWNTYNLTLAQAETKNIMHWIYKMPFVLSANLHGGSVVASYPYDSNKGMVESGSYSKAPDDAFFRHLALTYATNHPIMKTGHPNCPDSSGESFKDGITNGAYWYNVPGGMQDFNYLISNCFEITIELSCCKYPKASVLKTEWNRNKESLLAYIEQIHKGIKGKITDENNKPIKNALVHVGIGHPIKSIKNGDYWRLLLPGIYNVTVSAKGFENSTKMNIQVLDGKPTVLNFSLMKTITTTPGERTTRNTAAATTLTTIQTTKTGNVFVPINTEQIREIFAKGSKPKEIKHHNYKRLTQFLNNINAGFPSITKLYSIGQSIEGRELWVLELSNKPGFHQVGKPEFKYVANMHGNEVVGRECLLLLIQFLCENYRSSIDIQRMINSSRLHFMPTMNPDGYERAIEGDRDGVKGRNNAMDSDLNRNFPDQFDLPGTLNNIQPETQAIIRWIAKNNFVMSVNLHGGALVANYPFDDSPSGKDIYSKTPDDTLFRHLTTIYSDAHPMMHYGNGCIEAPDETFDHGITNGAQWYSVSGGMQDYNYLHSNDFEITVEMGCFKFPPEDRLQSYWDSHKVPLLRIAMEMFKGLKGFVSSSTGFALGNTTIHVHGIDHHIKSLSQGDYFRLLLPGTYVVTASISGYVNVTKTVVVYEGPATILNFTLSKDNKDNNDNLNINNQITKLQDNSLNQLVTNASATSLTKGSSTVNTTLTTTPTQSRTPSNTPLISTTLPATSKPTKSAFQYHTYDSMIEYLKHHQTKFPDLVQLHRLGSDQGKDVWCVEITTDVGKVDTAKANVALIAGLHAEDAIGREVLMMFLHHLTKSYTNNDSRIRKLLSSVRLHVVPTVLVHSMDNIQHKNCSNDNFTTDRNSNTGQSSEEKPAVKIIAEWMAKKEFLFSAVVEGGDLVVSYPPDEEVTGDWRITGKTTVDNELFKSLSLEYSVHNKKIYGGKGCNGAERYRGISVGMDLPKHTGSFSTDIYRALNSLQINVHLSCCRRPLEDQVAAVWNENKESLMRFSELAFSRVYGTITDRSGAVVNHATIKFSGTSSIANVSSATGFYQKYLIPNTYTATADGHTLDVVTHDVVIDGKSPVRQDFLLLEKPTYKHHRYDDMVKQLKDLTNLCPNITRLSSIGKSVQGKDLLVLELSDNPGVHESGEAEFAYIAGIHGNELVGRELSLLFARHLCLSYGKEKSVTNLLNSTRIFIVPLVNPDGAESAIEGSCSSNVGHDNANGVDLATDFPVDRDDASKPTQPESIALSKWLQNRTSIMYATLRSGSLVVGYPYSEHWNLDRDSSSPTADDDLFRSISRSYSKDHPHMSAGQPFCPGENVHETFKEGIVNIAEWEGHYEPLLDYNYVTNKGLGIAIFTGCCTAPGSEELNGIWKNHKKAMVRLVNWVHKGVKGYVFDSVSKKMLPGASIIVEGRDFATTTSNYGDFWRILTAGSYKVHVNVKGYKTKHFMVDVNSERDQMTQMNFALEKSGIIHVSGVIFLALIASCVLVFLLMLFLLGKACHWHKRGRKYTSNGFRPLRDLDGEEPTKAKEGAKNNGAGGVLLEESELSDEDGEEEVFFNEAQFSNTKS